MTYVANVREVWGLNRRIRDDAPYQWSGLGFTDSGPAVAGPADAGILNWVGSDVACFFQLALDGEIRGIKQRRSRR